MSDVWSAVGSGLNVASGISNSILGWANYYQQNKSNQWQQDFAQRQYDFAREQYEYSKYASENRYQIQAQDMAKAGLNPILAAGGAPYNMPPAQSSGSAPGRTPAGGNAPGVDVSSIMAAAQLDLSKQLTSAKTNLDDSQADLNRANAQAIRNRNPSEVSLIETQVQDLRYKIDNLNPSEFAKLLADTLLSEARTRTEKEYPAKVRAETATERTKPDLNQSQAEYNRAHTQEALASALLKREQRISEVIAQGTASILRAQAETQLSRDQMINAITALDADLAQRGVKPQSRAAEIDLWIDRMFPHLSPGAKRTLTGIFEFSLGAADKFVDLFSVNLGAYSTTTTKRGDYVPPVVSK